MAKPKLTDFKRLIKEMTEDELRAELLKLFQKLDQVQAFYGQDLMTKEDRQKILDDYKKKVHSQYWTRGGNPRDVSNSMVRSILTEFEKVSAFPHEIVDLYLYRVEVLTNWANTFGGAPDGDYNASSTSFEKAMKLIQKNQLLSYFKNRIEALFRFRNIDYWYIDDLKSLYESYFPEEATPQ